MCMSIAVLFSAVAEKSIYPFPLAVARLCRDKKSILSDILLAFTFFRALLRHMGYGDSC